MRDCTSGDFYTVGPNGLPVKKREASQEWQKPRDGPAADQLLNWSRVAPGALCMNPHRGIYRLSGARLMLKVT